MYEGRLGVVVVVGGEGEGEGVHIASGHIWSHLVTSGHIWSHLIASHHISSHLRCVAEHYLCPEHGLHTSADDDLANQPAS